MCSPEFSLGSYTVAVLFFAPLLTATFAYKVGSLPLSDCFSVFPVLSVYVLKGSNGNSVFEDAPATFDCTSFESVALAPGFCC